MVMSRRRGKRLLQIKRWVYFLALAIDGCRWWMCLGSSPLEIGGLRSDSVSTCGRNAEAAWLDPKTQEPEKLLPLLKQYPPEEMGFYPVSREVNSPAVDKASNIEQMYESL